MKISDLIKSAQLPTLSHSLYEIIELEEKSPTSFFNELKTIIEKDPLLSVHILKIANSPFYGFPQKVRTVNHAISLLGIQRIRNIAFSYSIFDFLKRISYKPEYGSVFNQFLKKSLLISSVTTVLAQRKNIFNADEMLVAGLLADIGKVLLFLQNPQKYSRIHSLVDRQLIVNEKKTYGFDHIELGAEIIRAWKLPDFLFDAIRFHVQADGEEECFRVIAIANQIAEWLLTEDEDEKRTLWNSLEEHAQRVLSLSLREIEDTVHRLPDMIDTFIRDFPELQKDLKKVLAASSTLIISLMKREVDRVVLTRELTSTQQRLTREKDLLAHMLNLSYFFSSLLPPLKIISSLFEYFEKFIPGFAIEFIFRDIHKDAYSHISNRQEEPRVLAIDDYPTLRKAIRNKEIAVLDAAESRRLGTQATPAPIALPIAFHHNLFGFLLLNVVPGHAISEVEVSYVRILANIIGNSFQNFYSFESLRRETSKKDYLSRELFRSTEEIHASRQLAHQSQKSEIASEILPIIFHKLKNKLTPIMGYAQILRLKTHDDFFVDRLEKIERNANELTDLLNILREYFKTDKPFKETGHIHAVIGAMQSDLARHARDSGIDFRIDLDERIPPLRINPAQMEILLSHLIENAVAAVAARPAGERIVSIRTRLSDGNWTLLVRDNGVGIAADELGKISSPFYSTFEGHAGLGLSICERIVANHDGQIRFQSEPDDHTEVSITFPLPADEPAAAPAPAAEAKPAVRGRVLIIDDEEYLLDLMKEVLANEPGLSITTCSNSREAMNLLAGHEFDGIVLDVRMPELDGMEIYGELRKCGLADRVLVVTADPKAEDVSAFLRETRVRFLQKPFELMKFRDQVIALLD